MATHSSVLVWRIPGMGKPGGLPSMGSHRVGHDWSDLAAAAAAIGKWAQEGDKENSMKVHEIREQSKCRPLFSGSVHKGYHELREEMAVSVCLRQREPRQPPRMLPWLSFVFGEGRRLIWWRLLSGSEVPQGFGSTEWLKAEGSTGILYIQQKFRHNKEHPWTSCGMGVKVATTHVDQWSRSRADFGDFSKYKCG